MSADVSKRLAVNSVYSLFLETKDESAITFHHVLQRVNVLLQERLAYALFEKKDGKFKLYYPFLNDPIGAPKLASFYREKFGSSETPSEEYGNLGNYLFPILGTRFYLFCIRVLPLTYKNDNRFQFVKLKVTDDDRKQLENIRDKIRSYESKAINGFDIDHDADGNDDQGKQRAVLIRYVLGKVFTNEEASAKGVGFRKISENFVAYQQSILSSIKRLNADGCTLKRHQIGSGIGYWYQDKKFAPDKSEDFYFRYDDEALKEFDRKMNGPGGALELAYLKVDNSIRRLLSGDEARNDIALPRLTNFIFFQSRALFEYEDGTKETRRKKAYPFGLKISIPESQKKDISKYFSVLKRVGKTKFAKQYRSYKGAFSKNDDWVNAWTSWLDDEFWRIVKSEPRESIIDILTKDFGEMRSIVDPVFYSNHTFYPFPFEKSGVHRVLGQVKSLPDKKSAGFLKREGLYEDCLRIVILYYLVFGMMPENQRRSFSKGERDRWMSPEDLALSVVPLSVHGATFGCVAHYASLGDSVRLQNSNWQRNFNLYHNIDKRFIRELRKQLERMYLRHIRENVENNVVYLLSGYWVEKRPQGAYMLDYTSELLSNNMSSLSGSIPFDFPKISLVTEKMNGDIDLFDYQDVSYYVRLSMQENKYFHKFFTHSSRLKEKVTEAVSGGVNAALTAVRVWDEFLEADVSSNENSELN